MNEVTEEEFWQAVFKSTFNLHPRIDGPYPYTSVFIDQRTGAEFGKVVDQIEDGGNWPPTRRHYLK